MKIIIKTQERRYLFWLLLLRIASVFLVKTSFVPDEYWQSLEIAHKIVFGYGYLTWEWTNGIRTYLYPAIISVLFKALYIFNLDYSVLLIILPRIFQAFVSAIGDVYTVKTARDLYGEASGLWTFRSLLVSWFLFYCGSRTLTNTMETALTSIAFYFYPCLGCFSHGRGRHKTTKKKTPLFLSLVALTVIIRPTSAVIWAPLCLWHILSEKCALVTIKSYATVGAAAIIAMLSIDRIFYGYWTCTLYNFVHFNVLSGQSGIYGSHPFHWYWSQGFPIIMTSHLVPFVLEACRNWKSPLLALVFWQLLIYSFISHKEFRFIMPILPIAMCLVGKYLASIKGKARLFYAFLIITNVPTMLYFGLVHQKAPLDTVMHLVNTIKPSSSILFLMPCHSVPLFSHLHQNVTARFLTCEPNLIGSENYMDEADYFYANPKEFLRKNYGNSERILLPSHIILFDKLATVEPVAQFIIRNGYILDFQYFHTHFPEGRVGKFINIYVK